MPHDLIPLDGLAHEVSARIGTSYGMIHLYIDRILVGSVQSLGAGFRAGVHQWQSGEDAGFGMSSSCSPRGSTNNSWPFNSPNARIRIWDDYSRK